jgi:hypothetical protein
MSSNGVCYGPWKIAPGLSCSYSSANKATVTGTPTNAGTFPFSLTARNGASCTGDADTRSTAITIIDPNGSSVSPSWTVSPPSQVAQIGSDTILNAAASANPPPSYYWRQGITNIPGATNASFAITNVQLAHAGIYTVFASNFYASAAHQVSTNAYLSVVTTPGSLLFAYTNYVPRGSALTMTCGVSNVAGAINKFQWQLTGANIPGQSGTNLVIASAGAGGYVSGTYTISIVSYLTNSTSTNFLVGTGVSAGQGFESYWIFGNVPTIKTNPVSLTNNAGTIATFTVVAAGDSTNLNSGAASPDAYGRSMRGTNYQWYLNSIATPLANETNASLTVNNISAVNAGNYFCVVTNVFGAATSSVAALTVNASSIPPNITNQPSSQIVAQGATVQLAVTAGGSPTPSFQWKKENTALSDGATSGGSSFSGSSSGILTIINARTNDSGNYTVSITNNAGGAVSEIAHLLVVAPATGSESPTMSGSIGSSFGLSFTTVAGYRYIVQRATNLNQPTVWIEVTNIAPSYSSLSFSFSDLLNSAGSYYRVFVTNN